MGQKSGPVREPAEQDVKQIRLKSVALVFSLPEPEKHDEEARPRFGCAFTVVGGTVCAMGGTPVAACETDRN